MAVSARSFEDAPNELTLCIARHAGLTRRVTTIDGDQVDIIFPGHWTHGHGPDFRDAMVSLPDGQLLTGDVELHFRARDWERHQHHIDPAYNDVILHIVTSVDGFVTRRANGGIVTTAPLSVSNHQLQAVHDRQPALWAQFGGDVCAASLSTRSPSAIRTIVHRLGDRRLDERVAAYESAFSSVPPTNALFPALFDAFGFTRNREQMRALETRIPWSSLLLSLDSLPGADRHLRVLSLMLGVGGFLPLSPAHANRALLPPDRVAEVESEWLTHGHIWHGDVLPSTIWDSSRVRPANHPVARIATLAALLSHGSARLVTMLLDALRDNQPVPAMLQDMIDTSQSPALGEERAVAITASVVIPFAVAVARITDDPLLEEMAHVAWDALPAASLARPARRARSQIAGNVPIRNLRERGNQGLLLLDKRYCGPRRCFECPVAHAVVADTLASADAVSSEWTRSSAWSQDLAGRHNAISDGGRRHAPPQHLASPSDSCKIRMNIVHSPRGAPYERPVWSSLSPHVIEGRHKTGTYMFSASCPYGIRITRVESGH